MSRAELKSCLSEWHSRIVPMEAARASAPSLTQTQRQPILVSSVSRIFWLIGLSSAIKTSTARVATRLVASDDRLWATVDSPLCADINRALSTSPGEAYEKLAPLSVLEPFSSRSSPDAIWTLFKGC